MSRMVSGLGCVSCDFRVARREVSDVVECKPPSEKESGVRLRMAMR